MLHYYDSACFVNSAFRGIVNLNANTKIIYVTGVAEKSIDSNSYGHSDILTT